MRKFNAGAGMSASDPFGSVSDTQRTVLDEEHLGRMTLGDRGLEREVLQVFVRQSATIIDRIAIHDPVGAAALAHTMIGSARGIGAWRVVKAAEHLERVVGENDEKHLDEAIAALKAASLEVSAAIDARLIGALRPDFG
jgi:HPt (histidine-containing phosphotransfer) domain-containing protein